LGEITEGFSFLVKQRATAVLVPDEPMFNGLAPEIAKLAVRHKLPSCFGLGRGPEAGGLMSYGLNYADVFRRAATYVDKILKGANPGDLPIEQPTKFEMIINLNTAKALGIAISQELLFRADRVIE
jgi:putative ABC transport system substrate-binding protein